MSEERISIQKGISTLCAMAIFAMSASAASSQTWQNATGKIQAVTLSSASNFAFGIILTNNGLNPISSCTASFAFINTSDDNYQAKVSTFLSAYAQSKTVSISYITVSGGYCQITDLSA